MTFNVLRWSETAGLKQVVRDQEFDFDKSLNFVHQDFERSSDREVA